MPAATLCELCQSISFHDLPPFPDDSYIRTLSGYEHLQEAIHREKDPLIPEPLGFHHHPDLEGLRRASAAGCELCRQVEIQADRLLGDVAEEKAWIAGYPEVRARPTDPSFDLWVTKRGQGGDGFWVVTKSASMPEKELYIVATFGFCSENGELSADLQPGGGSVVQRLTSTLDGPLALALPGRPIVGPPDDNTLDRVAGWVKACDSHKNCLGQESVLPTRLIDLGGPGPESVVKVVETEEGTRGTYTALSYCWGTMTNPHATTRSLLGSNRKGMEVSSLPRTFRDAITMTRRLGVQYIWIDSLCICQDDLKDWERESARMASVYSNAYVTIAATGGPDASHGLFFDRPEQSYLRVALKPTATTNNTGGDALVFPLLKSKEFIRVYRVNMVGEPLADRAWAFQERLLSKRILHFASDQISFECLEGTVMEDGLRMLSRYFHAHPGKGAAERSIIESQRGKEAKPGSYQRAVVEWWYSLLRTYGDRKLTFPSDKFPALSGVANIYAGLLDDEYVAGIWRKTLIEGLCWQSLSCTSVEEYRAPSWSWASVDGTTATGFISRHRDVATVVDHLVEIDGDNPFGRVKDAWLKIRAPLTPLTLSEKTGPTGHMCLRTPHGDAVGQVGGFDTIDRKYSVSADLVKTMELYVLVLVAIYGGDSDVEDDGAGDISVYSCLIVAPAGEGEVQGSGLGAMKRVGWILYAPENFEPGELDASTRTITLI